MNFDLFSDLPPIKFNPSKVAFGRHETFGLRYSWLPKGFHALQENPAIFDSEDATVALGVGKNMVSSIRFWLRATQMMHAAKPEPTKLGERVLDRESGYDPFLEDEATIWLLHWLLCTNTTWATSWYWFFNRYHKTEFTSQELTSALSDFVKEEIHQARRPSASTIKNDAGLIHRMYSQSKGIGRMPLEEALDSPLSLLRLITQSSAGRSFRSAPQSDRSLPIGILGFAVSQLFHAKDVNLIPIEDLMYSKDGFPAPGSLFRLTEGVLLQKLEMLVDYIPGNLVVRETAGIHQLYATKSLNPTDYLDWHYESADSGSGVAA